MTLGRLTPNRSRKPSSAVSEDIPIEASVLAPGHSMRGDMLARLLVWPLLIFLMGISLIFYIMYSPLHIDGDSMEPTLHSGDRVLRTKFYDRPRRGDIVIIDTESSSDTDDIVKRVVALAGDTIEIHDDQAIVNGALESTTTLIRIEGYGLNRDLLKVPPGHVYVLGDNRPVSLDSRMIGPIPVSKIRGRAEFIFLPVSDFRRL